LGKLNSLDCNKTDEDTLNDILVPVKDDTNDQTYKNELKCDDNSDCSEGDDAYDEDEDDGDDSGWITPQNIAHKKQEITSEADDKPVKVACITADFAMQVS
jgi:rRNA maturation endonuclease Nob1